MPEVLFDDSLSFFKAIEQGVRSVRQGLLDDCASAFWKQIDSGGTIFGVANGGSSAVVSHFLLDSIRACGGPVAWGPDLAAISCLSNDLGYEHAYAHWLERVISSKDVLILVSSSGNSSNIFNAGLVAREKGAMVISLSGFSESNNLRGFGDWDLYCPSDNYNVVESVHSCWLLYLIEYRKYRRK